MRKMKTVLKLIISLAIVISSYPPVTAVEQNSALPTKANSNPDAIELANILSNTMTFEANFEQNVYREDSTDPDKTLGRFLIQRPNHFRWETSEHFEQAIIADGLALWTYDPELEQATIQDQRSVLADSPLLLLTSSVDDLVKAFDIQKVERKDDDGQQLFALEPVVNGLFESVHILIKEDKISEFFLLDTLGGRTSVIFSDIKLNQKISMKEFQFVPPEGLDIIDSREVVNE